MTHANMPSWRGRATTLRRRATRVAIDRFFETLAAAGRFHPKASPERHGIDVVRDLRYGATADAAHRLDVWRPRGDGPPRPCVLYVHGGGFRILSKDTHWIMALMFARAGYVVFNVNYRLVPKHPFPAALHDVLDAFQWVVAHAREHGADASRIVLAGESAGANLVTSLALATSFPRPEPWARAAFDVGVRPAAVVPACGLLQVSDPHRFARRWPHISKAAHEQVVAVSEGYLSGANALDARTLELADPLAWLEGAGEPERPLPPFFVACGTRDPLIDDARRLHRELERRRTPSELVIYERGLHAFHAFVFTANARKCWADTFRFLDAHVPAR